MENFLKNKKIDDQVILQLWYQGAGDLYRRNHGLPSNGTLWARLRDNPKERLFSYIIHCVGGFIFVIILMYFIYLMLTYQIINDIFIILIIGTTGILSLMLLFFSVRIFISAKKLNHAIKLKTDTDLADSYRMESLRKAIYRLIKEGKIIKENEIYKINKTWIKVINSNTIQFTKKEKIAYIVITLGLIGSGLYIVFSGCGGGTVGLSGCYDRGITARITGLIMIIGGAFLLRITIKSPTILLKNNNKK